MNRRAGIDVGGTKFLGVVIDAEGAIVAEQRIPTTRRGAAAMIDDVVRLAHQLQPWDSLGIGLPGLVTRDGMLKAAPNLVDVNELAVGPIVGGALGVAVQVDNDGTCAAVAEWRAGAARGAQDVLMVALGTGIGGGLISNGRLQRGANGFAGEIGHMVVDPDGPLCPCGRSGCWERFASGTGLANIARTFIVEGRLGAVLEAAGGNPADVRGEHVQDAARAGDADASEVLDTFGRWVALGLVNLTNILDPATIVLGGGLASAPDLFLSPIETWFETLLYSAEQRPSPRLVFAQLGQHAGAIGAAMLASEHQDVRLASEHQDR